MKSIGYHFFEDGQGLYKSSRCSDERPLIINCAGNYITDAPMMTKCLGRLDYYFLYVIEGELSILCDKANPVLRSGDYIIIPPNTPYTYARAGNSTMRYFWVHFTGSEVSNIIKRYELRLYPEFNSISDGSEIISSMRRFTDACTSEELYKDSELSILFERILLRLARKSAAKYTLPLKKSISYINAFYNTELKIPLLAKMEGLSISRYSAVFKGTMGMTPCDYIIKTRLAFAFELLSNTDLSIKEISVLVGYEDAHFFSRIFRKKVGISPREYRVMGLSSADEK